MEMARSNGAGVIRVPSRRKTEASP